MEALGLAWASKWPGCLESNSQKLHQLQQVPHHNQELRHHQVPHHNQELCPNQELRPNQEKRPNQELCPSQEKRHNQELHLLQAQRLLNRPQKRRNSLRFQSNYRGLLALFPGRQE